MGDSLMSIEVVIERYIIDQLLFGDSEVKLDPDQNLITGGLLDSVAILQLIVFIEEQFNVTVEDGEVLPDNFQSINLIKEFVERKQQALKTAD